MSPEPVAKTPPVGEGATEMTGLTLESTRVVDTIDLPEFL